MIRVGTWVRKEDGEEVTGTLVDIQDYEALLEERNRLLAHNSELIEMNNRLRERLINVDS